MFRIERILLRASFLTIRGPSMPISKEPVLLVQQYARLRLVRSPYEWSLMLRFRTPPASNLRIWISWAFPRRFVSMSRPDYSSVQIHTIAQAALNLYLEL